MKIFTSALGEPISRVDLVTSLGRDVSSAQDRAIDVQITRLRRKIEVNPGQPVSYTHLTLPTIRTV